MIVYNNSVASCAMECLKYPILVFVLGLALVLAILWSSLYALIIIATVGMGWLYMQASKLLNVCTGPKRPY